MKGISLLAFFLLCSQAYSANYTIYFGGGGESKSAKDTIFDVDLKNFTNYYSSPFVNQDNIDIVYNGGHENTEKLLKSSFNKKAVKNFNRNTYNETLLKYKKLIESGQIKAGDKLFISIDTHGASNISKGDLSHQVASGTASDGSENISLDTLKSIIDLAKKKGVKLAIADLSCFSGNTQKLADANTCVVSATGPNHLGWKANDTFSAKFMANMIPGRNLEDVFLRSRVDSEDRGFPMISTPENQFIFNKVYPAISPYLYFKNDSGKGSDNLDDFLFSTANQEAWCKSDKSLNSLLQLIGQVEKHEKYSVEIFSYEITFKEENFDRLKKLLIKNHKDYRAILMEYYQYRNQLKNKVAINFIDQENKSKQVEYTLEQVFSADYNQLLKNEQKNPKPNKMLLSLYQGVLNKQAELKAQNPKLLTLQQKIKSLGERLKESFTNSYRIAMDEKRLYMALYKEQLTSKRAPNPCRDFTL